MNAIVRHVLLPIVVGGTVTALIVGAACLLVMFADHVAQAIVDFMQDPRTVMTALCLSLVVGVWAIGQALIAEFKTWPEDEE